MGVRCVTPQSAIRIFFAKVLQILRDEIVRAFKYLGEQCVKQVRERSKEESWIDQTGNLRSSIGYAVYDYGKSVIESAFEAVKGKDGTLGEAGSSVGKKIVEELAKEYSNAYALVVIAGMSYAEYVEAIESKDVLASTRVWAEQKMNDYMQKAVNKAIRRINALKI